MLIFLILVVQFVVMWFVAQRFDEIAQMKGQLPKKFFGGVFGWVLLVGQW